MLLLVGFSRVIVSVGRKSRKALRGGIITSFLEQLPRSWSHLSTFDRQGPGFQKSLGRLTIETPPQKALHGVCCSKSCTEAGLQRNLAHEKTPTPLGPPWDPSGVRFLVREVPLYGRDNRATSGLEACGFKGSGDTSTCRPTSPYSGRDCVRPLRSSYTRLHPQRVSGLRFRVWGETLRRSEGLR